MILTIQVPEGSRVLVKAGDSIDFGMSLFEIPSKSDSYISFAQKFRVEPSKIFRYLKKFVGEDVKKGDILAVKKGLFSSIAIKSDYEGIIKEIDHSQGHMVITSKGKKNMVNSFVIGEVIEMKDKKISIKVKEGKEYYLKKTETDFGGKALYFKDPSMNLSDHEVSNKILISESLSSYNQSKMEALGIKGYVSLMKLPEQTDLPSSQLKTIEELKEIMKHTYPYCYIDSKSCKIIFYK